MNKYVKEFLHRGLIFAGAGGSTSQLANSATSFTSKVGTAVGKTATGAVATGMDLASRGKSPSSESNKDGGKGGGGGGGGGGAGCGSYILDGGQGGSGIVILRNKR